MTDAVRELVAAAERTADLLDRHHLSYGYEGDKLRVYVEAVKAEEKPQTHEFVCMFMTERRCTAREGPCGVAFCGQPADAPAHQSR